MKSRTRVLIGIVVLGGACSTDERGEGMNAVSQAPVVLGDETEGCTQLQLPSPDEYDVQIQLGTTLEPGTEGEFCAIQRVGARDIWMNWSDTIMSAGSHHGLLWQASYEGELPETDRQGDPIELGKLKSCEGGANSRFEVKGVLAGSQGSTNITAKGMLPADTALHIPAHSYVVTNFHMLNATEHTLEPCLKAGIHGIEKRQVAQEAGVLFFYNDDIAIPAAGSASARMACPISQPISLKSAVSHMHARGVGYEAKWLSGDPYDPDTETLDMLYETTEWDGPRDQVWSEPKQLAAGHFIDYSCHYENPDPREIAQGLDTTDEMCMFTGVYWPRNDAVSFCLDPKTGRDISYKIGAGELTGPDFMACVTSSDFEAGAAEGCGRSECRNYSARYHLQSCFTEACPAIGRHTQAYFGCLGAHAGDCERECAEQPGSCTLACLNERECRNEVQALQDTACD